MKINNRIVNMILLVVAGILAVLCVMSIIPH